MRLVSKREIAPFPLYDITVDEDHCFELAMGIIAHNSLYPKAVVSGGCVEEGTMIQVLNGAQAIEEIVKGTIVPTMAGNKLVTETWTPDTLEFGEVDCYELEFEDGFKVIVSGQHPFLTENGWVDAEDMREGDVALKL